MKISRESWAGAAADAKGSLASLSDMPVCQAQSRRLEPTGIDHTLRVGVIRLECWGRHMGNVRLRGRIDGKAAVYNVQAMDSNSKVASPILGRPSLWT
jgi:hypothetical protein